MSYPTASRLRGLSLPDLLAALIAFRAAHNLPPRARRHTGLRLHHAGPARGQHGASTGPLHGYCALCALGAMPVPYRTRKAR